MGTFDYFQCEYALPVDGQSGRTFQTKDTPNQTCDTYKVDSSGQLWVQEYDVVDRSTPDMEPLVVLLSISAENHRWVHDEFTGRADFYAFKNDDEATGWIEFRAHFFDGMISDVTTIENRDQ